MKENFEDNFEDNINIFIQNTLILNNKFTLNLMKLISYPFRFIPFISILILLFLCKAINIKQVKIIFFCEVIIVILKNTIQRTRPCHNNNNNIIQYDYNIDNYSFPSGHTLNATILAYIIYKKFPQVGYNIIILPIIVGFSRVYLGVHYLSDVISAMLLGYLLCSSNWLSKY